MQPERDMEDGFYCLSMHVEAYACTLPSVHTYVLVLLRLSKLANEENQ